MHSLEIKKLNFLSFTEYVFPSVAMMVVMALYSIVDGAFVATFVGSDALAGVNIVYPINNLGLGIGIMFATGSSAVVSMLLGQGKKEEAEQKITLSLVTGTITGLVVMVILLLFFRPILLFLGVNDQVYDYSFSYGLVMVLGLPLTILKEMLVSYLRVDGRPALSLFVTVLGGVINIFLDWLFVVVFGWGVLGAAVATVLGIAVGMLLALYYFLSGRSHLRLRLFRWDIRFLLRMSGNGSSEMVNQISAGITTLLFNLIAMRFYGPDGVAAVTIMMYAEFIFISLFLGLAMGCAPLISYNLGACKYDVNRKLIRYSALFIASTSLVLFLAAFLAPQSVVLFFAKPGTAVYEMAIRGLKLFSFSLFFSGTNLFVSGLFTALGNGPVSAGVAMARSMVFLVGSLLLLPELIGFDGVWLSIPLTELLTLFVSVGCLIVLRNKYHLVERRGKKPRIPSVSEEKEV